MIPRLMTTLALLLCAAPARGADPLPAQLAVSPLAEPAAIRQDGEMRLYYELTVTNFNKVAYTLEAVDAVAGAARASFDAKALAAMIRPVGAAPDDGTAKADLLQIAGGRSAVLFLSLDLGPAPDGFVAPPPAIATTLHVLDDKGGKHDVALAPLAISSARPIVVGAPLRGEWIAGDAVNDRPDAAHRRAAMVDDGRVWIAQRYAIDWVQYQNVDGRNATWRGPEDKNESYFCWDKPIYSVAAGTVVEASDGLPENVPHTRNYAVALTFQNAAGNHAVIEIAPHRYVLYAHMRPGSVRVKAGDKIAAGALIGHVGNTGSSLEPHLHIHIDDRPSFLGGNGVPFAFASGMASGPVVMEMQGEAEFFGPIGPQKPFTNDYPAMNALVTFK